MRVEEFKFSKSIQQEQEVNVEMGKHQKVTCTACLADNLSTLRAT